MGVGALLQTLPPLFVALKLAGGGYLVYLGYKALRAANTRPQAGGGWLLGVSGLQGAARGQYRCPRALSLHRSGTHQNHPLLVARSLSGLRQQPQDHRLPLRSAAPVPRSPESADAAVHHHVPDHLRHRQPGAVAASASLAASPAGSSSPWAAPSCSVVVPDPCASPLLTLSAPSAPLGRRGSRLPGLEL